MEVPTSPSEEYAQGGLNTNIYKVEKKKRLIGNCSWEKIKGLGSVEGEMGWFLNLFLNHKALSVCSAQNVKAFSG